MNKILRILCHYESRLVGQAISFICKMRLLILFFSMFFISWSTLTASTKKLSEPYKILTRIKSPYKLVTEHMPKRYTVPVTLSGSIADEIKSVLDTIDIDMPKYLEIFNNKKGFQLIITNEEYTSQTRDLLSGILNPIEMIDVILNSVLKYREIDNLIQMQKETTITKKKDIQNGSSLILLKIKPKGKRFSYIYRDMGAYIHESWLTTLSIIIDSNTMLARELSIVKHSRVFTTDQQRRPSPTTSTHRYVFAYTIIQNSPVPSHLDFYVDSILTLIISATYRLIEGFILFDKREIKYLLPDKTISRLLMEYDDYVFNIPPKAIKSVNATGKYTKKLKRAATYARKAIEALNKGHIQSALSILRTITNNYPGTPQAVEAQKLLSGLPNGL